MAGTTTSNRYWDDERCAWVTHEPATTAAPSADAATVTADAVPEQRSVDAGSADPASLG